MHRIQNINMSSRTVRWHFIDKYVAVWRTMTEIVELGNLRQEMMPGRLLPIYWGYDFSRDCVWLRCADLSRDIFYIGLSSGSVFRNF